MSEQQTPEEMCSPLGLIECAEDLLKSVEFTVVSMLTELVRDANARFQVVGDDADYVHLYNINNNIKLTLMNVERYKDYLLSTKD